MLGAGVRDGGSGDEARRGVSGKDDEGTNMRARRASASERADTRWRGHEARKSENDRRRPLRERLQVISRGDAVDC